MQTIDIEPMASPRPRFSRHGTYMPSTYTKWKQEFLSLWQMRSYKTYDAGIPLAVTIRFYVKPPDRIAKAKKNQESLQAESIPVVVKPDTDNYIKSVLDALNGEAWADDNQIVAIHAVKLYSLNPRIELEVAEWYTH